MQVPPRVVLINCRHKQTKNMRNIIYSWATYDHWAILFCKNLFSWKFILAVHKKLDERQMSFSILLDLPHLLIITWTKQVRIFPTAATSSAGHSNIPYTNGLSWQLINVGKVLPRGGQTRASGVLLRIIWIKYWKDKLMVRGHQNAALFVLHHSVQMRKIIDETHSHSINITLTTHKSCLLFRVMCS